MASGVAGTHGVGRARVTEVTAGSDGLTEAVSGPHMALIMVGLKRLRRNAGVACFKAERALGLGAPRPG